MSAIKSLVLKFCPPLTPVGHHLTWGGLVQAWRGKGAHTYELPHTSLIPFDLRGKGAHTYELPSLGGHLIGMHGVRIRPIQSRNWKDTVIGTDSLCLQQLMCNWGTLTRAALDLWPLDLCGVGIGFVRSWRSWHRFCARRWHRFQVRHKSTELAHVLPLRPPSRPRLGMVFQTPWAGKLALLPFLCSVGVLIIILFPTPSRTHTRGENGRRMWFLDDLYCEKKMGLFRQADTRTPYFNTYLSPRKEKGRKSYYTVRRKKKWCLIFMTLNLYALIYNIH
jgi:hypothetical protein